MPERGGKLMGPSTSFPVHKHIIQWKLLADTRRLIHIRDNFPHRANHHNSDSNLKKIQIASAKTVMQVCRPEFYLEPLLVADAADQRFLLQFWVIYISS